jgi:outer membrane scaffolding protein for murein synthesis (MipA/OmpV family)
MNKNASIPTGAIAASLRAGALTLTLAAGAAQAQQTPQTPIAPAITPATVAQPAVPSTQPLWEFGLGAALINLPDYRGADQRSNYLLPLPYVVYRGKYLRADREGARLMLLDTDRVDFDFSLNAGPPAHSNPDGVRAGMAKLPATVEFGPKLRTTLWRSSGGSRLNLDLPLRTVFTFESSPRHIGTVFAPNLELGLATGTPWRLGMQIGPMWGSRSLHSHYYGVAAAEAVSSPALQRPAYEARGGYAGWHALGSVSRRFERHWVGAFVRHDHLGGAVFADSPLVRDKRNWSVGVAAAWVFASSSQQVSRDN